jgi:hypothetical protein
MNRSTRQFLLERLEDERSKRVIFLSHCLLNENTRYLRGAFRPGGLSELVDGWQGVCQMHCPEQHAWGGVLKRSLLPMYGSRGTLLYRLRHVLLPLFLWYTRWRYRRLAKEVVGDIEDHVRSGIEVVGVVFVAAMQRELRRKHLSIRWYEHDLLSEIRGQPICLRTEME